MEGSAPPKKNGVCGLGEGLGSEILMTVPSTLSPESQTPVCPYTTLICSTLPPLEPGMSGCEQGFLCWPFKRVPGFLVDSHLFLVDRLSTDSHSQMLCGVLFPNLMIQSGEPGMGLRFNAPHWRIFVTKMSLWILHHHM